MIYAIELNQSIHEQVIAFVDAGPEFGVWFRDVFVPWLRGAEWPMRKRSYLYPDKKNYIPAIITVGTELVQVGVVAIWTPEEFRENYSQDYIPPVPAFG
jgi:hypothetical protein